MGKKYYKYELSMTKANILAIVFLLPYIIAILAFPNFFKDPFGGKNFIMFFILMLIYFALHELCHGIGYSLFAKDKKNIKYGIVLEKGALYAMCQEIISKKGIFISLALPLFILTFIAIPIGILIKQPVLVELALINFMGASGDIMMLNLLRKFPKDVEYIDYNNDIGAYFISKTDLSNIKSFGLSCTASGPHKKSLIDKTFKKINITKTSTIITIIIVILLILGLVF